MLPIQHQLLKMDPEMTEEIMNSLSYVLGKLAEDMIKDKTTNHRKKQALWENEEWFLPK